MNRTSWRQAWSWAVVGLLLGACGDRATMTPPASPAPVGKVRQALGEPLVIVHSPQTIPEDSPLFLSAGAGTGIAVSDAENTRLTVKVTSANGVFVPQGAGGVTTTGSGTTSVTMEGRWAPLPDGGLQGLNQALEGARFIPAPNFSGAAVMDLTVTDTDGNVATARIDITVTPFNDPPVNGVPTSAQSTVEDTPYTFSLPVTDVDLQGGLVQVTLSASNGSTVSLSRLTGLTLDAGVGTADTFVNFSGLLPDVNAALNGLTVTPPRDYVGATTVTITSYDFGNTGAGLPGEDTDVVTFNWSAVNDPPVNAVPGAQTIQEEGTLTFAQALGTALRVSDVDATSGLLQVTLDSPNGALSLGNPGAVSFAVGDGIADATMTFTGTLAALNSALEATTFTPTLNFAGATSVTLRTSDLGASGAGGAKVDLDTVPITVTGVNDLPVVAVPGAQFTNEDTARVFSVANGAAVTVTDVDTPALEVRLTATNGVVTLASRTGLSFQAGDGIQDPLITFSGAQAAIATALNGLTFQPTPDFSGAASLAVEARDNPTGAWLAPAVVSVSVAAVNDPPDAVNDAATVAEDAAPTAIAVLANDTTAPDVGETLTLVAASTPAHGTASLTGSTVTYQPQANFSGVDSFTYTVSDGTTTDGTPRLDTATVTVTVTPVNDDPTATADTTSVQQDSGANVVNVLSNDSAAPDVGETLTVSSVGTAAHGTVAIIDGGARVTYTPAAGYVGPDAFTYTVSDGNGGTATATVSVTVVAVFTRPVNVLPAPQTTVEDAPVVFSAATGNAIVVSDPNSTTLTVQVQVTQGIFLLGSAVA